MVPPPLQAERVQHPSPSSLLWQRPMGRKPLRLLGIRLCTLRLPAHRAQPWLRMHRSATLRAPPPPWPQPQRCGGERRGSGTEAALAEAVTLPWLPVP